MPKAISSKETLLSCSSTGLFSIQEGHLAPTWTLRAMSGNPIPKEHVRKIFSKRMGQNHDSISKVIAKVKILSVDVDGAAELQLLEHAYLKS